MWVWIVVAVVVVAIGVYGFWPHKRGLVDGDVQRQRWRNEGKGTDITGMRG